MCVCMCNTWYVIVSKIKWDEVYGDCFFRKTCLHDWPFGWWPSSNNIFEVFEYRSHSVYGLKW